MSCLKFRCWDLINNQWIDPFDFCVKGNGEILLSEFPISNFLGLPIPESVKENLCITQSTGLIDMKGIEIYEDDIIKYLEEVPYIVKYNISHGESGCWNTYYDSWCGFNISKYSANESLVIGNIFESKELLDKYALLED